MANARTPLLVILLLSLSAGAAMAQDQQQRLFELIAETNADGVLIISGDRHWAELSVQRDSTPYAICDLTSSSFNQIHPRGTPTENRHRADVPTYHHPNFGAIAIDWTHDDPLVKLQVLDINGKVRIEKTIQLSELRAPRL